MTDLSPIALIAGQVWTENKCRYVAVKINGAETAVAMEMVESLDTTLIDRSPINRTWFDQAKAQEMLDSVRQQGQVTPAIVRQKSEGRYELIAGERRWHACSALGLPLKAVVRSYTETEAAEILLLENLEREDLRPVDEAKCYQALLDLRDTGGSRVYSMQKIALRVLGDEKKVDRVARVLKLLQLPKEVATALDTGVIPLHVAFLVGRIADPKDRERAGKEVLKDKYTNQPMTVKAAAAHISKEYQTTLMNTKLNLEDADLLDEKSKKAFLFDGAPGEDNDGSCARCPWLAKNNPAYAGELSSAARTGGGEAGIHPMTCTRAKCHQAKLNADWKKRAEPFVADKPGLEVLDVDEKIFDFDNNTRHTSKYAALREKPNGYDLGGDWAAAKKSPKWDKILANGEVPVKVACDARGEPALVVERSLAIAAGKRAYPVLFAKAVEAGTHLSEREKTPEEKAAESAAKRAKEIDQAVSKELAVDAVKELQARIVDKGLGIEGRRLLLRAMMRGVDNVDELALHACGKALTDDEVDTHGLAEQRVLEALPDMPLGVMEALCVMAAVIDDVVYSGPHIAEDFQAFCDLTGVDTKAIEKRIRKAYDLAEKDRAKQAAKAAKEPVNDGMQSGATVSGEQLYDCDKCGGKNFTKRGLSAHKCEKRQEKASADEASEIVYDSTFPQGPDDEPSVTEVKAMVTDWQAEWHNLPAKPKKDSPEFKAWDALRKKIKYNAQKQGIELETK